MTKCYSCGAEWPNEKVCLCKRDLNPMKNVLITVSDSADYDMFRKTNDEKTIPGS